MVLELSFSEFDDMDRQRVKVTGGGTKDLPEFHFREGLSAITAASNDECVDSREDLQSERKQFGRLDVVISDLVSEQSVWAAFEKVARQIWG